MSAMSRLATEVEMYWAGELCEVEQIRLLDTLDRMGYDIEDFRPQLPEYVRLASENETAQHRAKVILTTMFVSSAIVVVLFLLLAWRTGVWP